MQFMYPFIRKKSTDDEDNQWCRADLGIVAQPHETIANNTGEERERIVFRIEPDGVKRHRDTGTAWDTNARTVRLVMPARTRP
jgi:hypothetical protein